MKKRKELPHSISAYGVHMLVIIAGVVLFIAAYLGLVSNFSVTYAEQAISLPQTPQHTYFFSIAWTLANSDGDRKLSETELF